MRAEQAFLKRFVLFLLEPAQQVLTTFGFSQHAVFYGLQKALILLHLKTSVKTQPDIEVGATP